MCFLRHGDRTVHTATDKFWPLLVIMSMNHCNSNAKGMGKEMTMVSWNKICHKLASAA